MVVYQINCSFGEIVDKISILKIKLENVKDTTQKENILYEYNLLTQYIKKDDDVCTELYNELYNTNKILWNLEDTIRAKTQSNIYDSTFIECAIKIHKTNDTRYSIKNKLNNIYNSTIKEEKIYKSSSIDLTPSRSEYQEATILYEKAMALYYRHIFNESYTIFMEVCNKVKDYPIDDFICILYFSHYINLAELGYSNKYRYKMLDIIEHINSGKIKNQKIIHYCENIYCLILLQEGQYINPYLKNMAVVNNPDYNISPDNMSFLGKNDSNKTQLIYLSGGLGDIIMYSRFLDKALVHLGDNKIILLVNDCLYWIYEQLYGNISNILIVKYSTEIIPSFDAHCAIHMLFYYLGIGYDDIYENLFISQLSIPNSPFLSELVLGKKNIIINWKGNGINVGQKFNRSVSIETLEPLFKLDGINWISIQKDITAMERKFMMKYNISNLENIDNDGDAFKDTISLLNNADYVITIDTSIVHIAGTMSNVKCIVLLTTGCDWRWNNILWYPNIIQCKQKEPHVWDTVVNDIITHI